MSLLLEECVEYNEVRPICVATEKSKTFRLINKSGFKIRKVKVDKCLSQGDRERRCDFLMSMNEKKLQRVIFIELKGGDLSEAALQIYSTIVFLKNEFQHYRMDARIVGSRDIPGFISTAQYRKLAKEVLPSGGTIERATNKIYTETI